MGADAAARFRNSGGAARRFPWLRRAPRPVRIGTSWTRLVAAVAIVLLGEPVSTAFWIAAALMAVGVALHVTERREHEHTHEPPPHTHRRINEQHNQHTHAFPWDSRGPHPHPHVREPLRHGHPHYPDVHHR